MQHLSWRHLSTVMIIGFMLSACDSSSRNDTGSTSSLLPDLESADGQTFRGRRVANKCAPCHNLTNRRRHKTGPHLWEIVGRPAASLPDYRYSDGHRRAAQQYNIVWDEATLMRYFENPKALIPNNRMPFEGLTEIEDRRDLLGYLKTLR